MKIAKLYNVMQDAAKENPNKYVGVTKEGKVLIGDARKDLFQIAGRDGYEIVCVGHGKNESIKHFIYRLQ
ncbi:MAG: hypothetical protein A7316_02065 [Candidatus Altiarchaeales archaeon WOR_SM1_86-2]|nr:MAG: hypothetical protein A7316_02065 [Candidatus Altiarchaeales archaeon WOR_SM1_86-2]ODS41567.1 MAG: hypothetical protein A7315_01380 [Candidatus Altiarchaeales archaeon WOR_SM1_79]